MSDAQWMGLAMVGGMYAVFLLIGWCASRKVKEATAEQLILAGRSMPLWIATMTMTATWVDGGYLLGTAEGAFKRTGGIASGLQGGVCFGISLMLGGLFFAKKMRRLEYTTLVDPFEDRFGKRWAAVLMIPALLGEVIWGAELLAAIGLTFGVILDLPPGTAILMSVGVVTVYTMVGGMWSVAYTDAVQLSLVPIGMIAALIPVMAAVGGVDRALDGYFRSPQATTPWTIQQNLSFWDVSLMLALGGVPWNCYFQRVLACRTPETARWHSFCSGALTIVLTAPPLLLGLAAISYPWGAEQLGKLEETPAQVLPYLLRYAAPFWVGMLGLAAIIGAVTSSYSASILSAGSMFSWNVYRQLLRPQAGVMEMKTVIRASILGLSVAAAAMAWYVKSVQQLWFLTADLIFVLLVPQLVYALFDSKCNRLGSIAAFVVSLVLRLGGGEPVLGLPPLIPYPELFAGLLQGTPESWYEQAEGVRVMLFPFKTFAFAVGMVAMPVVSRLTGHWDAPRPLREPRESLSEAGTQELIAEPPMKEEQGAYPS
jgi:high affinity choline transporter 7